MKNKKLFLFALPILLPVFVIISIIWISYFNEVFILENEATIGLIFGILLMILGFYVSIVVFIAADDKVRVEFIELLKQIGKVIGLGVVGLLIYWKGLTYISVGSSVSVSQLLDIIYYGNMALAIIYAIGTIQLFKRFERKYHSTFTKISRVVLLLSSVGGLLLFFATFDTILLIISITLFVISISIRLFFMDKE